MGLTGNWDTRISRRALLRGGGAATAAYVLLGRSAMSAKAAPPFSGNPFALGVASGDPTPDGIVLWTRLAPSSLTSGNTPGESFGVRYEIAEDEQFRRIVQRGAVQAPAEEAHSVHAEIAGLEAATTYWYRFKWGPTVSPVGRTRTAPPLDSTAPMRFAFASCQNFTNGFFCAYADMAQQDLDLVVHLGDYIYEGPGVGVDRVRDHLPQAELFSLADYRTRHAWYKTDPDLRAAHAAFPWLMTWDDHEFKDNYADLDLDVGDPEVPLETVRERRAAAYLAYWEHSPLSRARKPVGADMPLYRRAQWGTLATFHVLDTRQHRSDQIGTCPRAQREPTGYCPDALKPERGMLGPAQREWLFQGLTGAGTSWNVLANQVSFAPIDTSSTALRGFNRDNWDGYVGERQAILDLLKANGITNTVVITGDKHQNSVRNVPPDYRSFDGAPVATEFVGTSISSEGDDPKRLTPVPLDPRNPHLLYDDFHRGYVRVTLDQGRWTNEFRVVDSVRQRVAPGRTLSTFVVENGHPGAQLL